MSTMILNVMQTIITKHYLDKINAKQNYQGLRIRVFRPALATLALSATELQHLSTIAADGVEIDELGTVKPDSLQEYPSLLTKSLWTLFRIGGNGDLSEQGIKKVSFSRSFRADTFPGLYSMIQASPSVESVSIVPPVDSKTLKKNCTELWQWIAYTLFCGVPSNVNKLQAFSLNVETLKGEHVEAMRDVISSADPVTKVIPRAASWAGHVICASRFQLSDPTKKNDEDIHIVESPHVLNDLPVLKRSKGWLSVLLPAGGLAWVHLDDVVAKQRWRAGPYPVKSIARVKLTNLTSESKEAVLGMLRLIGGGIKHLVLEGKSDWTGVFVHVDWLTEIFDICPNLEGLSIDSMTVDRLDFLLDAYKSGRRRLTQFKATKIVSASLDESLRRLFVTLGDSGHPAARYMSEFQCSPVSIAAMRDPIMVATTVAMLEKNERLRDLVLQFPSNDPDSHRLEECIEPFKIFDQQKISRALGPLDVRQRIAFLSVVTPHQERKRWPRAVEQLDSCVMSSIFEMAATCCERRVYLGRL